MLLEMMRKRRPGDNRRISIMKRLLIFDAYGTLISTGKGSLEATRKILALQEKDIDASEFYKEWKKYHRKHIDESNHAGFLPEKDIFAEDLKALYRQYQISRPYKADVEIMLNSLENRVVYPEVIESLKNLSNMYRVVIGSTTDTAPLMQNMQYNNLIVDKVYTSEVIRKYKPDKNFYKYILESEGVSAEDTVFIGDSLVDDVAGPQELGIGTILVDRQNKYDFKERIRPDYVVSNILEVESMYM